MKKKLIGLTYKGKKISFEVRVVPKWYEGIGLMFRFRESASALLFEFKKPVRMAIHSFFVFFPFVAIWLDENYNILDIKRVRPFTPRVLPSGKFTKLVEVPINKNYNFLNLRRAKERFK